ncbi:hypothetical protein [Streptomyces chartreusis]|uniref:hypothetical protein n=1 Tax=Streptomyces chartreusis TaxID=1969 RepID=UPI0037898246
MAQVLENLRVAGALEQVDALLARNPAAHATLDDPYAVTRLLDTLRVARAREQVDALQARSHSHVAVEGPAAAARPLRSRRVARPQEQAAPLAVQFPAAGHFDRLMELGDHRKRFRFGREPDGSAAVFWTWEDLE